MPFDFLSSSLMPLQSVIKFFFLFIFKSWIKAKWIQIIWMHKIKWVQSQKKNSKAWNQFSVQLPSSTKVINVWNIFMCIFIPLLSMLSTRDFYQLVELYAEHTKRNNNSRGKKNKKKIESVRQTKTSEARQVAFTLYAVTINIRRWCCPFLLFVVVVWSTSLIFSMLPFTHLELLLW